MGDGLHLLSGSISEYNTPDAEKHEISNLDLIESRHIKKEGFMVMQYKEDFPAGITQLENWVREGKIHSHHHIVEGFENVPQAYMDLFTGVNTGKMIVQV